MATKPTPAKNNVLTPLSPKTNALCGMFKLLFVLLACLISTAPTSALAAEMASEFNFGAGYRVDKLN